MNGQGVESYQVLVEEFVCGNEGAAIPILNGPTVPVNGTLPTDWSFSDNIVVSGTMDPYFAVNYSTVVNLCYKVTVTYQGDCNSVSEESYFVIVDNCIWCLDDDDETSNRSSEGINEDSQVLEIYPSPATDFVNISGLQEGSQLSIIDLQGRIVSSKVITSGILETVNVSTLSSGIYIVKALSPTGDLKFTKIIKQ